MNGINRRSQKVVCIAELNVSLHSTGERIKAPEPGGVYTVEDFVDNEGLLCVLPASDGTAEDMRPGITLIEIASPRTPTGRPLGWPIVCFRPVDERDTDISGLMPRDIEAEIDALLEYAKERELI